MDEKQLQELTLSPPEQTDYQAAGLTIFNPNALYPEVDHVRS